MDIIQGSPAHPIRRFCISANGQIQNSRKLNGGHLSCLYVPCTGEKVSGLICKYSFPSLFAVYTRRIDKGNKQLKFDNWDVNKVPQRLRVRIPPYPTF